MWPSTREELEHLQFLLAERSSRQPLWVPPTDRPPRVGAVFVATGDPAFAAVVVMHASHVLDSAVLQTRLSAPYAPGLLALRQGALLERTLDQLADKPDVLLVNATGRDHPRRAGLALHLGAACDLPTIGVTDRPLVAIPSPAEPGALLLEGELVGYRVRPRPDLRPLIVHAAWRTDPDTARAVVLSQITTARTPEPLREARRLARTARAAHLE